MKCTFMHKQIAVAELELDDASGFIKKINQVYAPINCCETLGISDVIPYLDQMIVLDYIIANEDRHLNNFGVVL